jgi:hypothetical protein
MVMSSIRKQSPGGALLRRSFLATAALVPLGLLAARALPRASAADALTLYVFVHTQTNAQALEKALEAALPGVAVSAFSRVRDFEAQIRQRPDAVLSLPAALHAQGCTVHLQGMRGGATTESYVLLATAPVTPAGVRSVGAVDLLGRAQMPGFVGNLLGGNTPAVTLVTKLVDLLPLLQLNKVDAVILPQRSVAWLRARTRVDLKITDLPGAQVGLPAVSFLTPEGHRLRELIVKAAAGLLTEIGVETWR